MIVLNDGMFDLMKLWIFGPGTSYMKDLNLTLGTEVRYFDGVECLFSGVCDNVIHNEPCKVFCCNIKPDRLPQPPVRWL